MTKTGKNKLQTVFMLMMITAVWSIILYSKRIFPFGNYSFCAGDMMEQVIPIYAHIWDFLHGRSALFFDWTTGLGNNLVGSLWHFSAISPGSIFFLFVSRENLEKSMTVFVGIKLLIAGYSFSFVLKKWIKDLPFLMMTSAVLLYVFQPFCMQYYMMPGWLDMVCLFPLVMYFLRKLLVEGKFLGYIITLSLFILMNMQQTFMLAITVILVVSSGLFIDKNRYNKHLTVFLTSSLTSVLLTSWLWIPGIIQTVGSARKDTNYSLLQIYESIWIFHPDKWYKIVGLGVMIGLMITGIIRNRKSGSLKIICIISSLLMFPIVLENSNLLWHGGSYQSFVYRFAYMMTFWIIVGGCYSYYLLCSRNESDLKSLPDNNTDKYIRPQISVLAGLAVCACMILLIGRTKESFLFSFIIISAGIIAGMLISIKFVKTAKICSFIIAVTISILVGSKGMVVWNDLDNSGACRANTIYDSGMFGRDLYNRVKNDNVYVTQTINMYSGFMGIGNYLPVCESDRISMLNKIGYARVGHRMSDLGGTPFSDSVLGFTYILRTEETDSAVYHREGTISDFHIYRSDNEYNPGILIKIENLKNFKEGKDHFDIQNNFAELILESKLFKEVNKTENNGYFLSVEEPSIVYCYLSPESDVKSISISSEDTENKRDNKEVTFSNTVWENGIISLGEYGKGDYVVEVQGKDPGFSVAYMSINDYLTATPDYADDFSYMMSDSGVEISADIPEDHYLFVPIYPDKGWKCLVNGQRTDILPILSGMLIPVSEGNNTIILRYFVPGLLPGIMISLMTALLLIISAYVILKKNPSFISDTEDNKRLSNVIYAVLMLSAAIIVLALYVVPIIFTLTGTVRILLGI